MALKGRYNPETEEMEWVEVPDLDVKPTNSAGNTTRDIQRFVRSCGYKPTAGRVEMIKREVSRTQAQNEQVERIAKETGQDGAYDAKGEVTRERIAPIVKKEQEARAKREQDQG